MSRTVHFHIKMFAFLQIILAFTAVYYGGVIYGVLFYKGDRSVIETTFLICAPGAAAILLFGVIVIWKLVANEG